MCCSVATNPSHIHAACVQGPVAAVKDFLSFLVDEGPDRSRKDLLPQSNSVRYDVTGEVKVK